MVGRGRVRTNLQVPSIVLPRLPLRWLSPSRLVSPRKVGLFWAQVLLTILLSVAVDSKLPRVFLMTPKLTGSVACFVRLRSTVR